MKDKELHVVVGHPYSDLGKGWLAASVASKLDTPVIIKIDPMLSPGFPEKLGIQLTEDGKVVSDDARTYLKLGLDFKPENNIVAGEFLASALGENAIAEGILNGEVPKITWADISVRLANHLKTMIGENNAVIEVGGCPDDEESNYLPAVIRLLSHLYETSIHVLSCYTHTSVNGKDDPKTRLAVRAVVETMQAYWGLPLHTLWIRRANVPETVSDEVLHAATKKVAFKTQLNPKQVVYVPNLSSPVELSQYIEPEFSSLKD